MGGSTGSGAGSYAVGRPELSRYGNWMAIILGCPDETGLSHGSAAALWGFGRERAVIEVVSRH